MISSAPLHEQLWALLWRLRKPDVIPCLSVPSCRSFRKKTALLLTTTCYLVQATPPSTTKFSKSDSVTPLSSNPKCFRAGFSERLHGLARDSAENLRLKIIIRGYFVQNYSHTKQFQIILGILTDTIIYFLCPLNICVLMLLLFLSTCMLVPPDSDNSSLCCYFWSPFHI